MEEAKGKRNLIAQAAARKIITAQVTEKISVEYKSPDDSEYKEVKREENILKTKKFEEAPVILNVDFSHTIPMRPYESAKISVGLSIPLGKVLSDELTKEIDTVYGFASKFIEDKMAKEIAAINNFVKSGK